MNGGIINCITRLNLVGYFYWVILRCTDPWILNLLQRFWIGVVTNGIYCSVSQNVILNQRLIISVPDNGGIGRLWNGVSLQINTADCLKILICLNVLPVPTGYFEVHLILLLCNRLKPTGHVMHQQFDIQQLYVLPKMYLCFLYISQNKQRLVPLTS
jgi:hypothetical protein